MLISDSSYPTLNQTNQSLTAAGNPNINKLQNKIFQFITNKKAALDEFIFTHKPLIIGGTEIWLSK